MNLLGHSVVINVSYQRWHTLSKLVKVNKNMTLMLSHADIQHTPAHTYTRFVHAYLQAKKSQQDKPCMSHLLLCKSFHCRNSLQWTWILLTKSLISDSSEQYVLVVSASLGVMHPQ